MIGCLVLGAGGCPDDMPASLTFPNIGVVGAGLAVEVGGDCDTNSAIVCGIVASYGTSACIPEQWLKAREPLPLKR